MCRCCSNNLPIDIYGLYREVVRHGGFVNNERYDDYNRWTGGINFGGKVRPREHCASGVCMSTFGVHGLTPVQLVQAEKSLSGQPLAADHAVFAV